MSEKAANLKGMDLQDALYGIAVTCVAVGVGMVSVPGAFVAVGGLLLLPVIIGWIKG